MSDDRPDVGANSEPGPAVRPSEAGSEETQVDASSPTALSLVISPQAVDQRHLGAVLHDYAETRSPLLGVVAVAAFEDARRGREALLDRLNQAEGEKEKLQEKYHDEREKRIAAENQAIGRGPLDSYKQYSFGAGCLIVGVGITVYFAKPDLQLVGGIIAAVGIPLILLGAPFFHKKP